MPEKVDKETTRSDLGYRHVHQGPSLHLSRTKEEGEGEIPVRLHVSNGVEELEASDVFHSQIYKERDEASEKPHEEDEGPFNSDILQNLLPLPGAPILPEEFVFNKSAQRTKW